MPRTIENVEITKITARVPKETAEEIAGYLAASGMYATHFYSAAMVAGARLLARQLNPEKFITPEMQQAVINGAFQNENAVLVLERVAESLASKGLFDLKEASTDQPALPGTV